MEPTPTDPPATGRAQRESGRVRERAASTPARRQGRVRAIARAAGRTCSRPSCDTPAAATLVFSYHEQVARVVDLLDQGEPQAYDLCAIHADRTSPPRGWELSDARAPRADAPRRLDDQETVAVLAAALRGETPPTRVSVLEGGRDEDADQQAPGEGEAPAFETGRDASDSDPDGVGYELEVYDDGDDEDPLRAALEELQRVSTRDDDAATLTAAATPLRRNPDGAGEQPAPDPTTAAPVMTDRRDDDLTLW